MYHTDILMFPFTNISANTSLNCVGDASKGFATAQGALARRGAGAKALFCKMISKGVRKGVRKGGRKSYHEGVRKGVYGTVYGPRFE